MWPSLPKVCAVICTRSSKQSPRNSLEITSRPEADTRLDALEIYKETSKEYRMTTLESVALDQRRWSSTALSLKDSNWARFQLMAALIVAGAILEAVALQTHASYPAVSQLAGYAGAAALALVLVVRTRGLQRERAQAWVMAAAAGQSLMSEMYRYRTSSHPYSDHFGKDPEATLLRRRDAIFEKVKLIEKYIVEPDPKPLSPLGPLDADA